MKPRIAGPFCLLDEKAVLVRMASLPPDRKRLARLRVNTLPQFFVEIGFCKANEDIAGAGQLFVVQRIAPRPQESLTVPRGRD